MKKKGFTLVELLAVIAIIAVLVIIVMPNIMKLYNRARKDVFVTEVKVVYDTMIKQFATRYSSKMKNHQIVFSSGLESETETMMKLDLQAGDNIKYCILISEKGKMQKFYVTNGKYKFMVENPLSEDDITEDLVTKVEEDEEIADLEKCYE